MYKIIDTKDGTTIGTTDKPNYIRKKESSGCYINATAKNAQGVAYKGTPYNLQGRDGVGVDETVILVEVDAGTIADQTAENSAAIDSLIISMLEA